MRDVTIYFSATLPSDGKSKFNVVLDSNNPDLAVSTYGPLDFKDTIVLSGVMNSLRQLMQDWGVKEKEAQE